MKLSGDFHLTYCSNIHPGETWEEVRRNLADYLPGIRRQLCPDALFGVGLRLSAQAAADLDTPERLEELKSFLTAGSCYVFTLNGFPYGLFHRTRVKEEVYLPDWKHEERLRYTNSLARIMAALLPDEPGLEGSVSTVPGAFKSEVNGPADVEQMARLMLRHVAELHRLSTSTGKTITLALEPEPCCYLETVAEVVAFFADHLFSASLLGELAGELGMPLAQAEEVARRHLGLCYDACHAAVEYEDTSQALAAIEAAGIKICKFQISSALKLNCRRGEGDAEAALSPFAEGTYLHQVVEKSDAGLTRFTDLPLAFEHDRQAATESGTGEPIEWRVHFHVPVFLEQMKDFATTQDDLIVLLEHIKAGTRCPYLEVETYTWDVLPAEYRAVDVSTAIVRELEWVKDRLSP